MNIFFSKWQTGNRVLIFTFFNTVFLSKIYVFAGIWAIINTSGIVYRGLLDLQDISHWDAMLKTNVIGVLRIVRKFQNFLRSVGGRIITLGATENMGSGLVAYVASRSAVEGISKALREEISPLGINIVTIKPEGITPELLFSAPRINK